MTSWTPTHVSSTNGVVRESKVADILEDEVTVGYRPTIPLEALWMSGTDLPQITFRRDLEFMQIHPIVQDGLEYYKSGIMNAEFWGGADYSNPQNEMGRPISADERVAKFVLAHADRFWQRGLPIVQEGGYPYGWAPGEHIYREVGGMMVWNHMKGFHPNDGYILSYNNRPVGLRIIRMRDPVRDPSTGEPLDPNQASMGKADLWFASQAIPAKAMYYAHRQRFSAFYGRSQLVGAWRPWRRLGWRDAVEQVIDAAVYRAGYKGPVVKHPNEDMQTAQTGIPATRLDGRGQPRRSAQDVARQMIEWAKAGAGFTMSSAQYPVAMGGGAKWSIDWPDHVMDVRPLIEVARYMEDQIMLGIGVPPELVRAGGTGSGYAGRSVPREAFLCGQQRVADLILQMFVEQVVRPLVLWNFGDVPFEISCKSLLKTHTDDSQQQGGAPGGQPDSFKRSQAMKDVWAQRKANAFYQDQLGQGGQSAQTSQQAGSIAQTPAMALSYNTPEYRRRVLEVAERVMRRMVA